MMTKVGLIKFLVLVFLPFAASAQKVKYKDIFALLNAKQYSDAEPFLKRYVKETDDNPNAWLYLGIIYQEKSQKNDILKQTALTLKNLDSAVICYDKAVKMIDEKEIKRNKEYYIAYNRRDLRTGEFAVSLSDVQFDLEKRKESLKERGERVKMVKHYFSMADSLYRKTQGTYKTLQERYADDKVFYLTGSEAVVKELEAIGAQYDSAIKFFEFYQASSQNLGKTGYSQKLVPQTITDLKKDGLTPADFYAEEVAVWEYKKWSKDATGVITKEIIPMRQQLIAYDIELNKLREKLTADSVSVQSDLTKIIDQLLYEKLRKFDDQPVPLQIFAMKIADLEYRSKVLEHMAHKDSMDMHLQVKLANEEKAALTALDSITTLLSAADYEAAELKYGDFITNTYQNTVVLKTYVKGLKDFADREMKRLTERMARQEEMLKWIVTESGKVPLVDDPASVDYHVLVVEDEKYTAGIHAADTTNVKGYFYTITPSRKPDIGIEFPLEKKTFPGPAANLKGIVTHANDQVYYVVVYSEEKVNNKVPVQVAKIYRTDGLAWNHTFAIDFVPATASYKTDTGVLTLQAADGIKTDLDKNGKAL